MSNSYCGKDQRLRDRPATAGQTSDRVTAGQTSDCGTDQRLKVAGNRPITLRTLVTGYTLVNV